MGLKIFGGEKDVGKTMEVKSVGLTFKSDRSMNFPIANFCYITKDTDKRKSFPIIKMSMILNFLLFLMNTIPKEKIVIIIYFKLIYQKKSL